LCLHRRKFAFKKAIGAVALFRRVDKTRKKFDPRMDTDEHRFLKTEAESLDALTAKGAKTTETN